MGAAKEIVKRFKGKVPAKLEELVTLPEVGRKTANVVLGNTYDSPKLTVDTPMNRINRLPGLTRNTDPVKIEFALMKLFPQKE